MDHLTIVATDSSGNQIAEAWRAKGLTIDFANRAAVSASWTLNADNDDLVPFITELETRWRVYDDTGTLRAHLITCPCTDNFDAEAGDSLQVTAAGPLYLLSRRTLQTAYDSISAIDQGQIWKSIIDTQNARGYSTGIRTNHVTIPTTTSKHLTFDKDKNALEVGLDMATALTGFDFAEIPTTDTGYMADLGIWAVRGSVRKNIAFEYAEGLENIIQATITNDIAKLTSDEHTTGRDTSRSDSFNATTRATYNQIFDNIDAYSDIADQTLLDTIRDQLLTWRASPRQIVTATLSPDLTFAPWTDFDIGDYIPTRIRKGRYSGDKAINADVRLYGFQIKTDDDSGKPWVSQITLSPDDQGG